MNDATTTPILDRVAALVADRHGVDRAKISADTDLFDDVGADSLDRVELAMDLEEAFEVEIPDELVETSRTVGQFARAVELRIGARDFGR
ncbi:acyl carrier protein [Aureimonas sp. Leaf324]|uniref:acyl carrier protein n=1 Tax=Aureimonas sp. Leaf324 TaxID=1736336 RepID=UPI0006F70243|nr:acyl carrier protein [Aureimonas sp. Leaf324]KQQ85848.1 hypothetical protein ASF65_04745 [Aureimonas sp. Leaf324]